MRERAADERYREACDLKRLLLFPGHRILAYEWDRGAFRRIEAFEPDDAGRAAFRRWLEAAPRTPVQLLVDVIEEEFHGDRVPHVIGRDRQALHRRTLEKHFRTNELRHIEYQGRLSEGRRDDRLLVAGLTNSELIGAWLEVIKQAQVPLKGIHSLPLVGEYLLPRLGAATAARVLLVSQQVPSTLRQSYYEHGRLRFSRLVPGRYEGPDEYAEFVRRELDQTLHFLETQRFHRRDAPIATYLLTGADSHESLRRRLSSDADMTCHLVPLERVAQRVGLRGPPGPFADTVFGHVLLRRRRPTNHYGHGGLRHFFFVQRARSGLRWLAAASLVAAVAVAGTAWLRGAVYDEAMGEAAMREARFQRLYEDRLRQLAEFDYRAVDVKNAVDLMSAIGATARRAPGAAMDMIGGVVRAHPSIALDRLEWVRKSPDSAPALSADTDAPRPANAALSGSVVGFGGDYRRAIGHFEAFVRGLRQADGIGEVRVTKAPFDLEPDAGVSGDSGTAAGPNRDQRAEFTLELGLSNREGDHG